MYPCNLKHGFVKKAALALSLCSLNNVAYTQEVLSSRALFQPIEKAVLSSGIAAQIIAMPFRNGEQFKKGDTLVKFDCRLVNGKITIARAQLKGDLKTLENKKYLKQLNSVSSLDVHLAAAAYEKSKGELDVALYQRKKCQIKAPFTGKVVQTAVNANETVSANEPLLEIINDTQLETVLVIPSKWLSWVKVGSKFTIEVDETRQTYSGHIVNLGASIDPVSQTLSIYGRLDDSKKTHHIIAGMSGTALFEHAVDNTKTSETNTNPPQNYGQQQPSQTLSTGTRDTSG